MEAAGGELERAQSHSHAWNISFLHLQENHIFHVKDLQTLCTLGSAPSLMKHSDVGISDMGKCV
jgi:hypothetical protein